MKKRILSVIALLFLAVFSASAYPPPEKDELRLNEFIDQQGVLDGKVVEVDFEFAQHLKSEGSDNYSVVCSVWTLNGNVSFESAMTVYFSGEEAKDFFEDVAKKRIDFESGSASENIFVLVDGRKLIALGEKYRKSKGIYKW